MKTSAILFVLFIGISSCKNYTGIPDSFDYGKVSGTTYYNSFFDFTFELTDGWQVMENSVMDSLRQQTQEQLESENPDFAKSVEAADVRTANLLTVLCNRDTNFILYSASLYFVAENIRIAFNVKDGKDYLEAAKKNLDGMSFNIETKGDIYPMEIAGHEFYVMNLVNTDEGYEIKQSYYATVMNGFAFTFVASWMTDEQREYIDDAIGHMKFGKKSK